MIWKEKFLTRLKSKRMLLLVVIALIIFLGDAATLLSY